jgi:hypothetical protein
VGTLSRLGGTFIKGFHLLSSAHVRVPLGTASQILNVVETIEMTESALRGEGFIFTDLVRQTSSLAGQVNALVKACRDAGYHKDLNDMEALARKIDMDDPEGFYGADALSDFSVQARSVVSDHATACEQLLDHIIEIDDNAATGIKWCEAVNENLSFMTAASAINADVTLYQAWQDFNKIAHTLAIPKMRLMDHLTGVRRDLGVIDSKIIERIQWGVISTDD